jgi:8-oxo-dGTP pyrophosphatase MutT (NUDIX family)
MTSLDVASVDVFVLRKRPDGLLVLLMRRGPATRSTGAWEIVHGRIEEGESPEAAAVREVFEETGLEVDRLYSVTTQAFYVPRERRVFLAVVFAAFVSSENVRLGPEHDRAEWLSAEAAAERMTWPRSVAALGDVLRLLGKGDAGPAEDVLRVM